MRHNISLRRKNQRGSAMLEGALTLVVFISLFVGAIDLAQILMVHQAIVERVRFAARVTAVNCCNATTVKNLILYGQTVQPTNAQTFYGLTSDNITVTFADQNTADQRVGITVSGFRYKSFTPMMAGISGNGIPVRVSIPLEQP